MQSNTGETVSSVDTVYGSHRVLNENSEGRFSENSHQFQWSAGDLATKRSLYRDRFERLRDQWKRERGPTSSVTEMATHPSYQEIIGMGERVLPLILDELTRDLDHWFWALKAITGEDPVSDEDRGNLERMAETWLQWARSRGYR